MSRLRLILSLVAGAACLGCDRAPEPGHVARPMRICSVNLTADEMLADLVETSRVIAVTSHCDDPGVSNVVGAFPGSVTRIAEAEVEMLVGLAPDLVIVSPYHPADFKELMRRSGLPRHELGEVTSSADVADEYRRLGAAVDESARAEEIVAGIERRAAKLSAAIARTSTRPRVLYVGSQFTAGTRSLIGEIIERAGAINVGAEMGVRGLAQFELESAAAAAPEWILVSGWSEDSPHDLGALAALPCVKEKRVIELPGPLLNSTARHWIDAAETLARRLHPGTFDTDGR